MSQLPSFPLQCHLRGRVPSVQFSLCLSPSLCVCCGLSVSVTVSVCFDLCFLVFLCRSVSTLCLSLSLSVCLSVSLSVCRSLSVSSSLRFGLSPSVAQNQVRPWSLAPNLDVDIVQEQKRPGRFERLRLRFHTSAVRPPFSSQEQLNLQESCCSGIF